MPACKQGYPGSLPGRCILAFAGVASSEPYRLQALDAYIQTRCVWAAALYRNMQRLLVKLLPHFARLQRSCT